MKSSLKVSFVLTDLNTTRYILNVIQVLIHMDSSNVSWNIFNLQPVCLAIEKVGESRTLRKLNRGKKSRAYSIFEPRGRVLFDPRQTEMWFSNNGSGYQVEYVY